MIMDVTRKRSHNPRMAYFLFIDESGHDRKASPYEVLAGAAIQDRDLWNVVTALHEAEIRWFGRRYSEGSSELKGKKILKTKVFKHARLQAEVQIKDIPTYAKKALDTGEGSPKLLKALALAKLNYAREVFEICSRFRCSAFASIIETDAPGTESDGLRKDYAYLFERFFYFLEDRRSQEHGVIVFDELEKTKSHILIGQTHAYFKDCAIGRHRAGLIIPEPLFVHSDLTTGIQIADLIAYIISWGFRLPQMTKAARPELKEYATQVAEMRHKTVRERNGNPDFDIWSFAYIPDLRTRSERKNGDTK
jgi:hypothetical protein